MSKNFYSCVRIRIKIISLLFFILFFLLIRKLFVIQVIHGSNLRNEAKRQRLRNVFLEPKRGGIYDRNLQELTCNISLNSIFAMPHKIENKEEFSEILSRVLGLKRNFISKQINKKKFFVWIKRKVNDGQIKEISKMNLKGIGFVLENKRFYPKGTLASHVIGFAGLDCQGLTGLEKYYDNYLCGNAGFIKAERYAKGFIIPESFYEAKPAVDGNNLVLTIDENIQYVAERELEKTVKKYRASSGVVIVMNPKTGEILAMSSYPYFDPNNFAKFSKHFWKNKGVSFVYEPGSTFKTFLASASIDSSSVKLNEKFYCGGALPISKYVINDAHSERGGHGSQKLTDIVRVSCNIGAAQVGMKLGRDKFYKYIKKFGFGERTGIDLPAEEKGIIPQFSLWSKLTCATVSFGQGIATTPIQMITAFSSIVNDGVLMKPYIVKEIRNSNGILVKRFAPQKVRSVIRQDSAKAIMRMLKKVVDEGTGKSAILPGYEVYGKTGTAQKVYNGIYLKGKYISSFIGCVSKDKPLFSMIVVIDEPKGAYYGAEVAAPCFKKISESILYYLGIPPKVKNTFVKGKGENKKFN